MLQPRERQPTLRQVHAHFFHQAALARDAVEITHQQQPQQNLRINRGAAERAVSALQPFPYEAEIHAVVQALQQMMLRDLIFRTNVIQQRPTARCSPMIVGSPPADFVAISVHPNRRQEQRKGGKAPNQRHGEAELAEMLRHDFIHRLEVFNRLIPVHGLDSVPHRKCCDLRRGDPPASGRGRE